MIIVVIVMFFDVLQCIFPYLCILRFICVSLVILADLHMHYYTKLAFSHMRIINTQMQTATVAPRWILTQQTLGPGLTNISTCDGCFSINSQVAIELKVNSHKHENAHNFLHTCPNQAIQSAIHIYSTRSTRWCNKIHGKSTIDKSDFLNITPPLSLSPNTTPLLNWHCPSCQSLKELIQHVGGIIKILLGLPSTFRSWIPFPFHQELLSVSILP